MDRLQPHRAEVDRALTELGLGWEAWPAIVTDPRLKPEDRLAAVLVLLGTQESETYRRPLITFFDPTDSSLDWLGRVRQPWAGLVRLRLPWTASASAIALEAVTRGAYDDRRVALAIKGAEQVCAAGRGDTALLSALEATARYLESVGDEEWRAVELRNRTRRAIASATPPDILDLSLLADGDAWAGPAREAVRAQPASEVAPLVRLLGDLGPRKPPQRWWKDVDQALQPRSARSLLRRWVELAAATAVVPEWPDSQVGYCRGTLFLGTNVDVVRAAALATSRLREDTWPPALLGVLARRGSAHNGMAGMPEALSLKVASAAVDALALRGHEADRLVLTGLLGDLHRRDLIKRITAALAT